MKKILSFVCLVVGILFSRYATGQQISKAEYFFDSDPGIGKGTAINVGSAADSVDITSSVSTTGLTAGFHAFFVRVKNNKGVWSLYAGRNFYLYPNTAVATAQIVDAEYFFDTDPGVGNGTAVSVGAAADSVDINSSVSTAGLASGFHALFVRVKNDSGVWSLYAGRNVYLYPNTQVAAAPISAAEYFFDSDPGIGNGTTLSVGTPADSIDINSSTSIGALSAGFHSLFVRVKNDSGIWSLYAGRNFYIDANVPSSTQQLVRAEAFFDTDPGYGNGIPVSPSFSPADSVNLYRSIVATGLAIGGHNLFVRVQNDSEQWSMALSDTFTVANRCTGVNIGGSRSQVCAGDSATITATGGTAYSWSNGDTTGIIKVAPPTTDTFYVQVSNTGCISDTDFALTVNPLPTVSVSGPDTDCSGSPISLTASGGGTYLWSNTATTAKITVNPVSNTTYTVAVTNEGCTKDTSVQVTVNPLPTISISSTKDTLTASGGATYVWNTGGTNDTIVVHVTGRYSVTATDAQGCSDTASYYIVVTGIAGVTANLDNISLYPNPNNGEFMLCYHLTTSNAQLQIIDITGRTIYEESLSGTDGTEQVNASALTSGLFFWQVISGNQLEAKGKMTVIK